MSSPDIASISLMLQNRAAMPDADFSKWVEPNGLADVILFLSSEGARPINGAAIPVYGKG